MLSSGRAWKAARRPAGPDASGHRGAVTRQGFRGQKARRTEDAAGNRKQLDPEGDGPSLAGAPRRGNKPVSNGLGARGRSRYRREGPWAVQTQGSDASHEAHGRAPLLGLFHRRL